MTLPMHVEREVRRVLDGAARRLLADQLDGDAIAAASGPDQDALDGRPDQCAALRESEAVPVGSSVDDERVRWGAR